MSSNEALIQYGTWAGWGYVICAAIPLLTNFNIWSFIRFIPDVALVSWEMAAELGGIEELYPTNIYNVILGWSFTFYTSDYAAQFVGMILGIVFGDGSAGLPVVADETYFNLAFPTSFSFTGMAIFGTLAWYLGLACIVLIQLGDPEFLGGMFKDIDLATAAGWAFANDLLAGLDFNFNGAIGYLTWMLPFYGVGFFLLNDSSLNVFM